MKNETINIFRNGYFRTENEELSFSPVMQKMALNLPPPIGCYLKEEDRESH